MIKIKKFKKTAKNQFMIPFNEEINVKVNDALCMVEKGSLEKGSVIIEGLMTSYPDYHTVNFGMGIIHAFREQYDEAIWCFKKALDIFPFYTAAQFNLALAYQKKHDISNTIKAYKKVVEMGSGDEDYIVKQAQDFLSNIEETIRKAEGIGINAFLNSIDIFEKAYDFMEIGKWQKAIVYFKDCLNITKNHYQSYCNMGLCYAMLGKREQALSALDRAIEIKPDYELAIVNRKMIANLKEDERIQDGLIDFIDNSKDYAAKKK